MARNLRELLGALLDHFGGEGGEKGSGGTAELKSTNSGVTGLTQWGLDRWNLRSSTCIAKARPLSALGISGRGRES